MFAINEVASNGPASAQNTSQAQVIASVVALQRVISGRAGAESGDASAREFSDSSAQARTAKAKEKADTEPTQEAQKPAMEPTAVPEHNAEARSIIEAQEASDTDKQITAAFQARHGLNDLLSVIRDPEDRMLPMNPAA
ncbi:hypothetical protein E4Z66_15430 [Aliishimia ponticola]|uniref:Uncharacterized protein n=1 Tax=Aliishimia ponticola TaxID=2499833 RepID=A0A4S4N7R7_9RHOB|nr:hypothetical protein [Aliishimia ponticola]THH35214.1 hypothetical protein E4Z66_15430 [Aliishimia ponticola]